jgi:thymidylate synthase (FAD)
VRLHGLFTRRGADALNLLDHGYVSYIEHWGSDERIIESARMSTSGSFRGWDSDARLLRYLWTHAHHTPFEMCGLTVEVQAPLFVFREWHRHRTQSYNELSARYTELPDLYYIPSIERLMAGKQSQTNKQSSETGFTEKDAAKLSATIRQSVEESRKTYEALLACGLARELARVVIPVNQYSRMRASANLRNWLAFLSLRTAPSAQWEIRQYADAVAAIVKERFPRTYELFAGPEAV